jgi:hypothetical protein
MYHNLFNLSDEKESGVNLTTHTYILPSSRFSAAIFSLSLVLSFAEMA